MKAYAFRRGGSSFVSSLDDLPAKLGARTNRARSLHQSVLLEMLELAKGAGDVVRNKPLDCVGIRAPGPRGGLGRAWVPCFYGALGIYSFFALNRVAP